MRVSVSARTSRAAAVSVIGLAILAAAACGDDRDGFAKGPAGFVTPDEADAGECQYQCSLDGRSVIRSCTGEVVETCAPELACGAARCQNPCDAAADDKSSNGCEFFFQSPAPRGEAGAGDSCYAAFVVNTSAQPVNLTLDREGKELDLSKSMFRTNPGDATTFIHHTGPVAPGESIILFLSDRDPSTPLAEGSHSIACPAGVTPTVLAGLSLPGTGLGPSFHLKADVPVSLVSMFPFGGAKSYIPSATLHLPVTTWTKEHLVVTAWEATHTGNPTTQIVASEDDTEITVVPARALQDAVGIRGGPAGMPVKYRLARGQYLQFAQFEELGGSIVTSNKPTSLFSGHQCAYVPTSQGACDTLGQQIPAFEQWGSEYVAVGYRPRLGEEHEPMPYRIVAARDGTRLDYDPAIPAGAPTELSAGQSVTFPAGVGDAFVVRTQDADHPIYVAAYMTGWTGGYFGAPSSGGWGDPEFVNVVPSGQYLSSYSFYADPTYDETSLVVVRAKKHGEFKDVWLECAGNLTDFRPLGTRGDYEFTRVDLSKGRGPGQQFGDKVCQSGLQRMKSDGPFTATVWGWGFAASYAYPGGMAHRKLVTTPLTTVN